MVLLSLPLHLGNTWGHHPPELGTGCQKTQETIFSQTSPLEPRLRVITARSLPVLDRPGPVCSQSYIITSPLQLGRALGKLRPEHGETGSCSLAKGGWQCRSNNNAV